MQSEEAKRQKREKRRRAANPLTVVKPSRDRGGKRRKAMADALAAELAGTTSNLSREERAGKERRLTALRRPPRGNSARIASLAAATERRREKRSRRQKLVSVIAARPTMSTSHAGTPANTGHSEGIATSHHRGLKVHRG